MSLKQHAMFVALFYGVVSTAAFSRSSFTGRASSVCSREELQSELVVPPTAFNGHRTAMSMPPFLKRLGFRKKKDSDEDGSVVTLEPESAVMTTDEALAAESSDECIAPEDVEEKTETQQLMEQVKEAGVAGVISYALWELGFWTVSVPVCIVGYREVTGHWPDFSNQEDLQKLGAEAFAFVNFARFAVPLRIGLALSTTPWIDENIVSKFMNKDEMPACEPEDLETEE